MSRNTSHLDLAFGGSTLARAEEPTMFMLPRTTQSRLANPESGNSCYVVIADETFFRKVSPNITYRFMS